MPEVSVLSSQVLPELEFVIDLGPQAPTLDSFERCFSALVATCDMGVRIAHAGPPRAWLPSDLDNRISATPDGEWTGEFLSYEILQVRRTSLASPWETVLTVAASRSYVVLYGAVALIAVERILRMIMDWQTHRVELEARRREIEVGDFSADTQGAEDGVVAVADEGDSVTAPDIPMAVGRFVQQNSLRGAIPAEIEDDYIQHVVTLSKHRILRVELRLGRDEVDGGSPGTG
ncbi:hypothetical protein ACIHFC_33280 [Streptomyces sp. NPDC052013]|uniref:hypothetical protein n=1 Tax=Streptomyces sp. NPDC052013 TaxID=3365679 RepID=UPI0037D56EDF